MAIVEKAWQELDIYSATQALKSFATGVLPSHWLEMVKSRLYDEDAAAAWTIHRIVRDFLSAFSPICPFFSHHISQTIYSKSAVDVDSFPSNIVSELSVVSEEGDSLRKLTTSIQDFNSTTWNAKKEAGISLNQPVSGVVIPKDLVEFTDILTSMHSLE
jgi:valyl-tRNA synthetase